MAREIAKDFRDLRIYRVGFSAALDLFEETKRWPKHEQYELIDQVRRSSRSVCRNLAEAWFKRRYTKYFSNKLSDAASEGAETLVSLDFAVACGYLDSKTRDDYERKYREVIGGLIKMMAEPEKWCRPSSIVREDEGDYSTDSDNEGDEYA